MPIKASLRLLKKIQRRGARKSTSGGVHWQYVDARRLSATKHMGLFQLVLVCCPIIFFTQKKLGIVIRAQAEIQVFFCISVDFALAWSRVIAAIYA
jgi:hypothetical protein